MDKALGVGPEEEVPIHSHGGKRIIKFQETICCYHLQGGGGGLMEQMNRELGLAIKSVRKTTDS